MDRTTLGICATDRKLLSQPMKEIVSRLTNEVNVVLLGNEFLHNLEVELWPVVDYFLCIGQKKGFPLHKARDYCKLVGPKVLNDLDSLAVLRDRKKIIDILVDNGLPVPKTMFCDKSNEILEQDDSITYKDVLLTKPFVEKPLDSTDHNVYVYYSPKGIRKMHRKMKNQSSHWDPDEYKIRRDAFLYQEYVQSTNNQDIKVYVVGDYVHAETRKSPTVDGIVERNELGKEKREAIKLTEQEYDDAIRVAKCFKHFICGFDYLRTDKGTYVIDVNGMSFVKGSIEYYDKASANLLKLMK
jgi:inositol hexakisphosphate/diphosphoinositol-pentakisphosphate kinase